MEEMALVRNVAGEVQSKRRIAAEVTEGFGDVRLVSSDLALQTLLITKPILVVTSGACLARGLDHCFRSI
jgi:hypothetical protein